VERRGGKRGRRGGPSLLKREGKREKSLRSLAGKKLVRKLQNTQGNKSISSSASESRLKAEEEGEEKGKRWFPLS